MSHCFSCVTTASIEAVVCHFRVKMGLKNIKNIEVSALMHLVIFVLSR